MQWSSDHVEYCTVLDYIKNRKYICAAEEVQGLMVSCMIELDKANLAGQGKQIAISISF
jgi:hypothetical protein